MNAQYPTTYHPSLNGLQFYNQSAIENFARTLGHSDTLPRSILFFGDEAVRQRKLTDPLRKRIADSLGQTGIGLCFPWSIVHLRDPAEYRSSHTGAWLYAKNVEEHPEMVLGLCGNTVKTTDPEAGFRLNFSGRAHAGPQYLRLFFLSSESSFDIVLDIDGIRKTYKAAGNAGNQLRIPLDAEPSQIEVRFEKNGVKQNSFECYGLSLENTAPGSITVHHAGMVGQKLAHILSESLFEQQIQALDPRLVVVDLEANEYYKHGLDIFGYQTQMVELIMKLRRSLPEVEILLLSSMDVKRAGLYLEDGRKFSEQVRIMSHTQNCIFWDWYWVAGGPYSMEKWADKGLSGKWLTALNDKGRALQSQSLSDAMFRTYDLLSGGQKLRSNIYNIDTIKLSRKLVSPELPRDSTNERWQYHTVKHGQTLYGVAAMYGVTMDQVMQWNQLISRVLYVGQVLKIESNRKPVATPPHSPTIKPKPKVVPVVYHSVKRGETLFSIAKKYGTSTTAIMRLNGLKHSRLGIGQRLRVR